MRASIKFLSPANNNEIRGGVSLLGGGASEPPGKGVLGAENSGVRQKY
jgi:hypothetical protein